MCIGMSTRKKHMETHSIARCEQIVPIQTPGLNGD